MRKILFVCTGNTCRSPMAEGIFNKLAEERGFDAIASSAGIFVTEENVSENSLIVCEENDIDISSHTPSQITADMINSADIILTMTNSHPGRIFRRFFGYHRPLRRGYKYLSQYIFTA